MSNEELIELLKYSSPHIIYVVTYKNKIVKLHTPIKLLVLQDIGDLKKDQIAYCTELKITNKGKTVFFIDDKYYHTYYFDILIE